jgi:cytochrome P450
VRPLPQSKGRLPLFGNALGYFRDPLAFLREMPRRYGDVVNIALGPMSIVLVSHPDLVEEILVTQNKRWLKDKYLKLLHPVLGDGLLSSEGDFWRRQRRLAQPAFHRDRIAGYAEVMAQRAEELADRWSARSGEKRDVHADMMRLTLEIVAETLFGTNVEAQAEIVGQALEGTLAYVASPLEFFLPQLRDVKTPNRRRFDKGVVDLDKVVYGIIEARRKSPNPEARDLLAMLANARDEDGKGMSDRQLRDECMTLFLAGHETTALNLSWTFWLLSQNPDKEKKLYEELRDVLGDRSPTLADVPSLPYTAHVLMESLRLYPPAWSLGREAKEDNDVGGYRVPAGEQVWFCPWSIQRDTRWFSRPDEFRPERWENDFAKSLPKYAYFPFGGGPRLCIGQAFAQIEGVLLLATLCRSFRLEIDRRDAPTPEPSVTLRPKRGLRARIIER